MLKFTSPKKLREMGVLGMNQRNADFIMRYNPRHLYPLVDNKLKTKQLAIKNNIAVPDLYAMVSTEHEISQIDELLEQHPEMVIKPAHGSGGNGILVLDSRVGQYYQKASGDLISLETIKHHISNILSGMYSLGGATDQAILEYRVQFDPFFQHISYQGVPDIRVIVFRGVPVTAMIRLPTRQSDGKANLHQGAMGVGIDIATGMTTSGVLNNKTASIHPDTGELTTGIIIPHWRTLLEVAVSCADTVGLGYLGVDLVLDKHLGPLVLELNARPGLSVQLATQQGLLSRLKQVEALKPVPFSKDERILLASQLH